ncbi:MAG: polymer-forming cytoskeletal protein [Candidatus Daviesbacteria bacterium]|nr:polymer-forming cytoskeletal protein [Candidatus Daviesbacteria bacterium]
MKYWLIALALCLLVFSPPLVAFAQTNLRSGQTTNLSSNETINKDYFASGNSVSLDGIVNGDAYLVGGDVTLNGTVNGDLLMAGGNLNINGTVTGNIRAAGGNININGKVGRNISAVGGSINVFQNASVTGSIVTAGGNINILSPAKDIVLAGGQVNFGSSVSGDINAATEQLTLSPGAKIGGNLIYWSNNKANINPGASVSGTVTQNIPPRNTQSQNQITRQSVIGVFAFFKLISFLTALIIGFLLIYLFPEFTANIATKISSNWLLSFGVGFLVLAITPILVIMLFVTIVGMPIAVIWIFYILFALWLAKIFVALSIGQFLKRYLKQTWGIYLLYSVGLIVYYLIGLIPIIGGIFGFIAALIGLGAIILSKQSYYLDLRQKKLI